jgi:hypothetical protein
MRLGIYLLHREEKKIHEMLADIQCTNCYQTVYFQKH